MEKLQVVFEGVRYDIDYAGRQLVNSLRPNISKKFSDLKLEDGYYRFVFDRDTSEQIHTEYDRANYRMDGSKKSIFKRPFYGPQISLPAALLDNGPVSDQAIISEFNHRSYKAKLGFVLIDEKITARLKGKQVIVDIDGDPYFLNTKFNRLEPEIKSPSDPLYKAFEIQEQYKVRGSDTMQFFFNTKTKQPVALDINSNIAPKDTLLVSLPVPEFLDPIGWNKAGGWLTALRGDTAWHRDKRLWGESREKEDGLAIINQVPVKEKHKAKVLPITDANYQRVLANYRKLEFTTAKDFLNRDINALPYSDRVKLGDLIIGDFIYRNESALKALVRVDKPSQIIRYQEAAVIEGNYHFTDNKGNLKVLTGPRANRRMYDTWKIPTWVLEAAPGELLDKVPLVNIKKEAGFADFVMVDQPMLDRITGKLPVVEVDGLSYTVDLALSQLVCTSDCSRIIDLNPHRVTSQQFFKVAGDKSVNPVFVDKQKMLDFPLEPKVFVLPEQYRMDTIVEPIAMKKSFLNPGNFRRGHYQELAARISPVPVGEIREQLSQNRRHRDVEGRIRIDYGHKRMLSL